ncbi:MAG: tripartite tricarboxylate transporter substrate binding protein [Betaproteobacteria bacterium]|nr:MAG: tripartite tricarboxylate transporter substrate binding protein [Betaproteobacteria bacterium]
MRVLALLAALALAPCTGAAAYPERPITMLVAYSPGGGTDLVARAIAPYLEKYLGGGAKIVVVNRAGAGGEVGFAALANSPADGYTIGFVNTPPLLTIPIERQAQFHWQRYDYIGNIIDDPCNFSVHAETPIRNLAELAAYAKAQPGEVTVGTTGIGSDDHIAMLKFERAAGVKLRHIPFKGSADVRAAIAGRQIMVAAINIGEALQYQKGGTPLRNLVQMSPARTNLAPELPTAREQGYDIEMSSLRGMAAPKGLPADIRERLVAAVERAAADPDFQAQAVKFFAPLRYLTPAQYEAIVRDADVMYRAMWRDMPWADK